MSCLKYISKHFQHRTTLKPAEGSRHSWSKDDIYGAHQGHARVPHTLPDFSFQLRAIVLFTSSSQPSPIHFTAVWMCSHFTAWCWGRAECHSTSLWISLHCIHCSACVCIREPATWNQMASACTQGHTTPVHLGTRCLTVWIVYAWGHAFLGHRVLIRAY